MSSPATDNTIPMEVFRRHARRQMFAFIAFVLWSAFLFWRTQENQDANRAEDREIIEAVDREALERDYAICLRGNDLRQNSLNFIEALAEQARNPDAAQVLVEQAKEDFAKVKCPPPPKDPGEDG